MEAAEKDATVTEKTSTKAAANTNSVNWTQKSGQQRQQQGRRSRSNNRGEGGRGKTYNNSNASKSSSSSNRNTNHQAPICYCCGGANHMARDCFHRYQTCRVCKKKGHLEAMCRAKKTEVQHVQPVTEDHREEESAHDFYFAEEDDNISRVGNVNSVYDGIRAEPMYVNVSVNDIAINMEVDTGTYATIISEEVQNKYFPGIRIEIMDTNLKAYGKVPLKHVGIVTNLKVKIGKEEIQQLKMIIMKGAGPTLIGRQ
ncbi:unnamed protein product [Lasius platythorax]